MSYKGATYKSHKIKLEGVNKRALEITKNRLLLLAILIMFSFSAIVVRLVELGVRYEAKVTIGSSSSGKEKNIQRGDIFDRNGVLLATSLKVSSLYANPKKIIDADAATAKIAQIFPNIDKQKLAKKLNSKKGFVWVKRHLHPKEKLAINNLGIPGMYFRDENKRTYPHGNLVSHVVGLAGSSGKGLSGLEKEFDRQLVNKKQQPLNLSIDVRVQDILHKELTKKFKEHQAKRASGIVMDVNNGEILAMVSLPDFNPNIPSEINIGNTFNMSSKGLYEMGSTFKLFTMAMAFDSDIINMTDSYDATKPIRIARFRISDYHAKKSWLSVPEVFLHSSNIGTAKIADDLGSKLQRKYMKDFGLLERLDLELPELASPQYPASNWGRLSTMTISYGHGISVTPVHVAKTTASIVNGGILYPATLLKSSNHKGKRVIKAETSKKMRKLLRLVVEHGSGKKANAKGYFVGGKTGTGEKAGLKKYDKKRLVSSFVSAFPMNDPKYVVLAVMDEPKGTKASWGYATAGWTAAPVVKGVIEKIAPILSVMPVDEDSQEIRDEFYVDYELKNRKRERKLASF